MMRIVSPGSLVIEQFPAFEDDGYSKRPGLSVTGGDFSVIAFHNSEPVSLFVEITETGITGEYKVEFTPYTEGVWQIQVLIDFNKQIWFTTVVAGPCLEAANYKLDLIMDGDTGLFNPTKDSLHTVSADVRRVLGLLHQNSMLDRQEYDPNNQLTFARLRVFDSAEHVPASPGGTEIVGLEQEYEIRAKYSGFGIVYEFTIKRIL